MEESGVIETLCRKTNPRVQAELTTLVSTLRYLLCRHTWNHDAIYGVIHGDKLGGAGESLTPKCFHTVRFRGGWTQHMSSDSVLKKGTVVPILRTMADRTGLEPAYAFQRKLAFQASAIPFRSPIQNLAAV